MKNNEYIYIYVKKLFEKGFRVYNKEKYLF